jgi:uncharacterized membrane protein
MQGLPVPPTQNFRATLSPHRSLGPRGFLIVMGLLGGASFATGLAFASIGAWPVLGFFGLDVLIVFVAFKISYRQGRLSETLEIERDVLRLTRLHPSGRRERFEFSAYWVRVLLNFGQDGRSALRLSSHGQEVPFAQFLTDDERQAFAATLQAALTTARRAPPGPALG